MRTKRIGAFLALLDQLDRPVSILDVGGSQEYWEEMGYLGGNGVTITLANVEPSPARFESFRSVAADARDLHMFEDQQFDIVFSNSVIEHVGGTEAQRAMAREVKRVGRRYFIQTPNRYFPIEPHFLCPFFQFMPLGVKTWLLMHLPLAWSGRIEDPDAAREIAGSIELLSLSQLRSLFVEGDVITERFFGLPKSYTVYAGW